MNLSQEISLSFKLPLDQSQKILDLLTAGYTPTYLARYRKSEIKGLSEFLLGKILEFKNRQEQLGTKRSELLKAMETAKTLTDSLRDRINNVLTARELDLYSFYKEPALKPNWEGHETLAKLCLSLWQQTPLTEPLEALAQTCIDPQFGINKIEQAQEAVRYVLTHWYLQNIELRHSLRKLMRASGNVTVKNKESLKSLPKYFHEIDKLVEPIKSLSLHRYFLIKKAEKQKLASLQIAVDDEKILADIIQKFIKTTDVMLRFLLESVLSETYHHYLKPAVEADIKNDLAEHFENEALNFFALNLQNQLLQPTLPPCRVMGLAPHDEKISLVFLGKEEEILAHTAIAFGAADKEGAAKQIHDLITEHKPDVICLPQDKSGAQELFQMLREILSKNSLHSDILLVHAAEASGYAATKAAQETYPGLDENERAAAYLTKKAIDPFIAILSVDPLLLEVGPHQHDVDQQALAQTILRVLSSFTSKLGIDLNKASSTLLQHVTGLDHKMAQAIVEHRNANGPFKSKKELLNVTGITPLAYQLCAGFIRLSPSEFPLDATTIHPDHHAAVLSFAAELKINPNEILKNPAFNHNIDIELLVKHGIDRELALDILSELRKPGRDMRFRHECIRLEASIREPKELPLERELKARVLAFSSYGIFVDIGLFHPALLHKSKLPEDIQKQFTRQLKVGQVLTVKVTGVDPVKNRVELKLLPKPIPAPRPERAPRPRPQRPQPAQQPQGDRRPQANQNRNPNPRRNDAPRRGPSNQAKPVKRSQFGTLADQFKNLLGPKE